MIVARSDPDKRNDKRVSPLALLTVSGIFPDPKTLQELGPFEVAPFPLVSPQLGRSSFPIPPKISIANRRQVVYGVENKGN